MRYAAYAMIAYIDSSPSLRMYVFPGQCHPVHARTSQTGGHVSSTLLPGCMVNNTFTTRMARPATLEIFLVLSVKVQSISCNIGPAERYISRNMDRSRRSGIG